MTLELAARAFEVLLGWSLLLQSLEQLRVQAIDRVGDWSIQRDEVPRFPRGLLPLLDRLFQPGPYRAMLVLRALLAVALMAGLLPAAGAVALFVIALALLLRWRGAFNGGSDFMTLVGLTGLLLAHAAGWRAGLWWVTLQALSSYFVSGWVKLLRAEWRTGRALPFFLDSGVYGPLPAGSLFRHPRVAQACAWAFTLWEGCFPLALLDSRLAAAFCAVAATFHFLVFWFFGLNRFFWAWMTTYPAILYAAS
ncbi:hypothetical protein ACT80S_18175 [Ramlibacter sp. MAHUQ-53]|uniref:hypothetical protein n=1 Tax=unclassified Ramlibacter TaxID=2617605 RepID=UPI00363606DD